MEKYVIRKDIMIKERGKSKEKKIKISKDDVLIKEKKKQTFLNQKKQKKFFILLK